MGKKHPYFGKSMSTNFPGSLHTKGFVAFSRTMRNWMGIGWEKKHPYYGKSMIIDFPDFPIPWVLLHFPVLWEIYGETHALPI